MKQYKGLLQMLLTEDEIARVKGQCQWQADRNEYLITPFYLKEKELKFPKLPNQ
jgi:hypothetical protein